MQAVDRGMASARRRFGALLVVLLLALLASGTVGYFIRYATSPSPAATSSPAHATAVAPGNPAGDRWWQDTPGTATTTSPVGDRWWQDAPAAPAAPAPGASGVADAGRRIDRG
ncbi:MAG TPA: hypothetical protein VF155_04580 [Candidatus Dormibacteraeota bacterium]